MTAAPVLEVVFFDVGGVMYDDAVYREALLRALRDLGAEVSDARFADEYERCRAAQDGSFHRRIAAAFLDARDDSAAAAASAALHERASAYWSYPPDALEPDVMPCLEELRDRYRLGIVANQPSAVRDALVRDGLDRFFEVWGISADVGLEKPDPRLYAHAIDAARVPAERSAMVGDRLDYDVVPAKEAGMRTVWVLRGEAPRVPTPAQLAVPDASVRSLAELSRALRTLERSP